jgi:transposase-like protein
MNKKYQEISLLEFQERYRAEEDCQTRLFELRWPAGFVCPRCEHSQYYHLSKRGLFQCKACGYQSSLTAGTVMHGTRTPLRVWFWAIFLMANDKRGCSALALSKRLQISYWRAWTMSQKIRQAMRERDSHCQLVGIVEIDDSFFGGPRPGEDKRGRGSSKTAVIVEVSTFGESVGFAKMRVVDQLNAHIVREIVAANIAPGQTVKTDGLPAYNVIAENGHTHQKNIVKGKMAHTVLKWSHTLVSNAKAFILGTFHGIAKKHLQDYLDEFCYRFNRRRWEGQLFDRLVTACAACPIITFSELTQ